MTFSSCDLLVVAPATANIIGKFASGIADDFLSTFFLSTDAPVIIAPAMNHRMYAHPVVQENIERLKKRGVVFVEPEEGYLACGAEGKGRLASPERIASVCFDILGKKKHLSSSGLMGFSLAEEAQRRGAKVILIAGTTHLVPPYGVKFIPVNTTTEMREAVLSSLSPDSVLIMTAAVADFRPKEKAKEKIKKEGLRVGFAAETEDIVGKARKKLSRKNLDLIIANDVSSSEAGFSSPFILPVIIEREGKIHRFPRIRKEEFARRLINIIEERLNR